MLRKLFQGILVLLVMGVAILIAIAPAKLVNQEKMPELQGDLSAWLSARESEVNQNKPIIPETEKRILWFDNQRNTKTPWSIVYLHGFSATRQEIAPVGEIISNELGANLFETRLTGHGLQRGALRDMTAEDWLDDAAEALAIGAAIGEKVIVMGTSTGATLALAMIDHPAFESVSSIILLSPNFAPIDAKADFLTLPGGPQLAYLMLGDSRSWKPRNEAQDLYWTTTYPTDSQIEVMRLVKFMRSKLPMNLSQSVLTIYSPDDRVVNAQRIVSGYESINSPYKEIISIPGSEGASNHVLAGNIIAPENNQSMADSVIRFVRNSESKTP
jgi:esterase/lipase